MYIKLNNTLILKIIILLTIICFLYRSLYLLIIFAFEIVFKKRIFYHFYIYCYNFFQD